MIYDQRLVKKKCDLLFSKLIRERGYCEKCGKTFHLQCAHIISRKFNATRWDLENALCLCSGDHLWWHSEPIEAARWLESKWPGRYDKLNFKRQAISKVDIQGTYLYLKSLTKER